MLHLPPPNPLLRRWSAAETIFKWQLGFNTLLLTIFGVIESLQIGSDSPARSIYVLSGEQIHVIVVLHLVYCLPSLVLALACGLTGSWLLRRIMFTHMPWQKFTRLLSLGLLLNGAICGAWLACMAAAIDRVTNVDLWMNRWNLQILVVFSLAVTATALMARLIWPTYAGRPLLPQALEPTVPLYPAPLRAPDDTVPLDPYARRSPYDTVPMH